MTPTDNPPAQERRDAIEALDELVSMLAGFDNVLAILDRSIMRREGFKVAPIPTVEESEQKMRAYTPVAEAVKTIRAALTAQGSVPAGYKLVPIRPTVEMLDAGIMIDKKAWETANDYYDKTKSTAALVHNIGRVEDAYKAMLSAAPTPPEQQAGCEVCENTGRLQCEPDSEHTHPCDTCQPEANKEFQRGIAFGEQQAVEKIEGLDEILEDYKHDHLAADLQLVFEAARRYAALPNLKGELEREEKRHENTIEERDAAENCVSNIFYRIVGESPQWSNLFGYDEAQEEILDRVDALRAAVSRYMACIETARSLLRGLPRTATADAVDQVLRNAAPLQFEEGCTHEYIPVPTTKQGTGND